MQTAETSFGGLACVASASTTDSAIMVARSSLVKRSAREVIERYYLLLTLDFHTNKKIVDDCEELCAKVPAKRTRNKIAGFVTQLMRKLQNDGYVHGVDLSPYLDAEDNEVTDDPAIAVNSTQIETA